MENTKNPLRNIILSIEVERKATQNYSQILDKYVTNEDVTIINEKWFDEIGLYVITMKNKDNSITEIKYPVNTIVRCSVVFMNENKEECKSIPTKDSKHNNNIVSTENRQSRVRKFDK